MMSKCPCYRGHQRILGLAFFGVCAGVLVATAAHATAPKVGAYYFEGWYADDPNAPGAFATEELRNNFPDRRATYMDDLWRADTVEAMEKQIDLAADAGISFFAFNWYWYGSPEVTLGDGINRGLKNFLLASNSDRMEFSISVNNSGPSAIAQNQWQSAVDMLTPYLAHERYVTVGNKPMLNLFEPTDPNIPFQYIQSAAQSAGLSGVSLTGDSRGDASQFDNVGLYAAIPGYKVGQALSMPYKNLTYVMDGIAPDPSDPWADPGVWNRDASGIVPGEQAFIPTVMAGFDERPWTDPDTSWYFNNPEYWVDGENWGRTPLAFAEHFQHAIDWLDNNPELSTEERIIMLYAWNEFGEGGYLAPTLGDPNGEYLRALRNVIPEPSSIAIICLAAFPLLSRRKRR